MPINSTGTQSAVEQLYLRSDKNKDKTITLDELVEQLGKEGITKEQAEAAFKAADRDGDGKITVEEVKQRALEVQQAQLKNSGLAQADLNKDGIISDGERSLLSTTLASQSTSFYLNLLSGGQNGSQSLFGQQNNSNQAYARNYGTTPSQPSQTIKI
ncbi:EF-hand domain-containing protein [Kiloniella sp. b19]|uniref:EF-hand domain-containing protein n=1 Tax=Kiloniella sp. GXU_MW_B19 TaxID=3141326 RepID=UPI0031DC829E